MMINLTLKTLLVAGAVALAAPANAIPIGNALIDRQYPTDTVPGVFVIDFAVGQTGELHSVLTYNARGSSGYSFNAYVLRYLAPDSYEVAYDTGTLTVPANSPGIETFSVTPFSLKATDLIAHFGQGIPLDTSGGTSETYYPFAAPSVGDAISLPGNYPDNRTYSIAIGLEPNVNQVPDGGTSVALFGMSLLAIGAGRKLAK